MLRFSKQCHSRLWVVIISIAILTFSSNVSFAEIRNDPKSTFISLSVKGTSLVETLHKIEKQTDFRFVYNPELINARRKVTLEVQHIALSELLDRLLKNMGLTYKQINNNLVLAKKPMEKRPGSAYSGEAGSINGKVMDMQSKEVLPGAVLQVGINGMQTTTNTMGDFSIVGIAEGNQQLNISFVGYRDTVVTIQVSGGRTTEVRILLQRSDRLMGNVIVEGSLMGQVKALNQQKSANTIKNIISADQIGRFPDPNAAEALQRVPGVNINRSEGDGEGRYVGLRGLPPNFTNVNINGEQTPSPEGDVRQTALDVIPSDQLASMEISKALTPDMDGDAISGSINLITKGATSRNTKISGTVGTEIQQNNPANPGQQYALMIAKRFGGKNSKDGKFGFLANATYLQSNRNVDQVENSYDASADALEYEGYELEDAFYIRKRLGLSGRLDFKPSQRSEFYLNGIFTQLYELDESRRYGYSIADSEIIKRIKHRQENQGVQSYNLGAKHVFTSMKLDYEASYSKGNETTPYEYLPVFGNTVDEISIDRGKTDFPRITSATMNGTAINWNDDSNYKFIESEHSGTSARSTNYTGKFNIEIPLNIAKYEGSLKFGAKVRGSERINQIDYFHLYEFAGDESDNPSLNSNDFTQGGDRSFRKKLLNGNYQLTNSVEYQNVHKFIDANPGLFEDAGIGDLAEEVANRDYKLNENVYAGYVMGTMNFSKWMILAGLRYEYTNLRIRTQYWDEENEVSVPDNNNLNYDFLLPMFHVKYEVDASSNIRFAATSTYARPNFVDYVSDDKIFSENDREAFIGNANLKPVSSINLDLLYEKYYSNVGILSGGIFYKNLSDFIYTQIRNITFNGVPDIDVYQSVNGGSARVAGIELAYQKNLTFLPGWMKGFGVYANYTHTIGRATFINRAGRENFNGDAILSEKIKLLPGQSRHIANFAISFNKGGFTGRIMANYNSRFVSEVGLNSISDIYVADRWQFDASFSQRISKTMRVYLEGVNLSNNSGVTYLGQRSNPYEYRKFGFWTRAGFKFDL